MRDLCESHSELSRLSMMDITIIGAGSYGARIAAKYAARDDVRLKAVVSRRARSSAAFSGVPYAASAAAWRRRFGKPGPRDIFDICVHQNILEKVLNALVVIGAKNFILPKPIALTAQELARIEHIARKHKLEIRVASQWHYAALTKEIARFAAKHRRQISRVEIEFSRTFDAKRREAYTPATAFLPHMLQILNDTKLLSPRAKPGIRAWSDEHIDVHYPGQIDVRVHSSLIAPRRTERLRIFLAGQRKPALEADFAGVAQAKGFTTTLKVGGRVQKIREDVLDAMIGTARPLTLKRYLPVARQQIRVMEQAARTVAVIGGGIFGALTALEIARQGMPVLLLERAPQIIMGASLVNQYRVHMGYHYPRDDKTAHESNEAKRRFEKMFGRAIVRDLTNHYLVAKEGSLTSADKFLKFCDRIGLPYKSSWPPGIPIVRDKIALSVGVPERIFDANVLRRVLMEAIAAEPNITLLTNANVTSVKRAGAAFEVAYNGCAVQVGALVNATYSNINAIAKSLKLPLATYQYELCEMPVARTPWARAGWSVIDGPFFGVMPYGFADDCLLYDVELSVLERVIGTLPTFKHDIAYYDQAQRRAKRFRGYLKKWKPYIANMEKCKYLRSMYMTRVVLPYQDKTDTRVTIVEQPAAGFWQIFSGKITRSVLTAPDVAMQVKNFFDRKR